MRIALSAAALLALIAVAAAEPAAISFEAPPSPHLKHPTTVRGRLALPTAAGTPIPAVVVLHSRNGIDGTGDFYGAALRAIGIATLEIEMFPRGAMPRDSRENLPHAFGALRFLAQHPGIDGARVGVLGFSRGGGLALMSASHTYFGMYGGAGHPFAAHAALYPACYAHLELLRGAWMGFERGVYDRMSARPLLILAGEQDDYESPDACPKLAAALPASQQAATTVVVYPGATHGWEIPGDRTYRHDLAVRGRGQVRYVHDAATAARSRREVVEFFRAALRP